MVIILSVLSAIFASLVAIFGKIGLSQVDSIVATTVRACIMAVFLILVVLTLGKTSLVHTMGGKAWMYIVFSGVAGALSWLCYFTAIKYGSASVVSALDRLSIVFVVILSALFLGEAFTVKKIIGSVCILIGALLFIL